MKKIGNEDVEDDKNEHEKSEDGAVDDECGAVCCSLPSSPCKSTCCSSQSSELIVSMVDASTDCSIVLYADLAMVDLDEQVGFSKQEILNMLKPCSSGGRDRLLGLWCKLEKDIFLHNKIVDQFLQTIAGVHTNVEELKSMLVMIPTAASAEDFNPSTPILSATSVTDHVVTCQRHKRTSKRKKKA